MALQRAAGVATSKGTDRPHTAKKSAFNKQGMAMTKVHLTSKAVVLHVFLSSK